MKDPNRSRFAKCIRLFKVVYPHITFIFSFMFIVFWILEKYNPTMGFLSGSITNVLMIIFFSLSLLGSVVSIFSEVYGIFPTPLSAKKEEKEKKETPKA